MRGSAAAGAWGGHARRPLALVVYVEPSRTELWGLLLDQQAAVTRKPFVLAAADEDRLLCDRDGRAQLRVRWDSGQLRWVVSYGAFGPGDQPGQPSGSWEVRVELQGVA